MAEQNGLKPERPIRRFDVFAEYRKQEEEAKGHPEDEAMGYGLWVAKVVAARRFGGAKSSKSAGAKEHRGKHDHDERPREHLVDGKWHALDDEAQTDALFEKEVVDRMGRTFYHRVFAPAIADARERGKSYETIRDTIRKNWKPG